MHSHDSSSALGAVDIRLSEVDCAWFFVLTRRGEEEYWTYFDEPQHRQRGKEPQSGRER